MSEHLTFAVVGILALIAVKYAPSNAWKIFFATVFAWAVAAVFAVTVLPHAYPGMGLQLQALLGVLAFVGILYITLVVAVPEEKT